MLSRQGQDCPSRIIPFQLQSTRDPQCRRVVYLDISLSATRPRTHHITSLGTYQSISRTIPPTRCATQRTFACQMSQTSRPANQVHHKHRPPPPPPRPPRRRRSIAKPKPPRKNGDFSPRIATTTNPCVPPHRTTTVHAHSRTPGMPRATVPLYAYSVRNRHDTGPRRTTHDRTNRTRTPIHMPGRVRHTALPRGDLGVVCAGPAVGLVQRGTRISCVADGSIGDRACHSMKGPIARAASPGRRRILR